MHYSIENNFNLEVRNKVIPALNEAIRILVEDSEPWAHKSKNVAIKRNEKIEELKVMTQSYIDDQYKKKKYTKTIKLEGVDEYMENAEKIIRQTSRMNEELERAYKLMRRAGMLSEEATNAAQKDG